MILERNRTTLYLGCFCNSYKKKSLELKMKTRSWTLQSHSKWSRLISLAKTQCYFSPELVSVINWNKKMGGIPFRTCVKLPDQYFSGIWADFNKCWFKVVYAKRQIRPDMWGKHIVTEESHTAFRWMMREVGKTRGNSVQLLYIFS